MAILFGGLINVFIIRLNTKQNKIKPLVTTAIGWLADLLIFHKLIIKLPRALE